MKRAVQKFLITDTKGRELGEGHGATKFAALVNLLELANVRQATQQAHEQIENGLVSFEALA